VRVWAIDLRRARKIRQCRPYPSVSRIQKGVCQLQHSLERAARRPVIEMRNDNRMWTGDISSSRVRPVSPLRYVDFISRTAGFLSGGRLGALYGRQSPSCGLCCDFSNWKAFRVAARTQTTTNRTLDGFGGSDGLVPF
jgi:hypothetical protein